MYYICTNKKMKKSILNFLLLATIAIFFASCNNKNKEVTDVKSLKEKYDIKFVEFKDCDDFANSYSEAMNLYFEKLENASDLQAVQEDKEFKELTVIIPYLFDLQIDKYGKDCPKFDSINKSIAERYQALQIKMMQQQQQVQPELEIEDDSLNDAEIIEDL